MEQRYPTLRAISAFYKVLAWVVGAGLILLGLMESGTGRGESFIPFFVRGLQGLVAFTTLLAISEGIRVGIDIEENTRATALGLKALQKDHGAPPDVVRTAIPATPPPPPPLEVPATPARQAATADVTAPAPPPRPSPPPPGYKACPHCSQAVPEAAARCQHCWEGIG